MIPIEMYFPLNTEGIRSHDVRMWEFRKRKSELFVLVLEFSEFSNSDRLIKVFSRIGFNRVGKFLSINCIYPHHLHTRFGRIFNL